MRIFWFMYGRIIITVASVLIIGGLITLGVQAYNRRGEPSIAPIQEAPPEIAKPSMQWDTVAITQMESEVISALQCASAQQLPNAPALQHDPTLSALAEQSITALQNDLSLKPDDVFKVYEWSYLAAIFEAPQVAPECHWADLDITNIDFTQFDQVGVAIIPPVGYAPANVLIVGRKSQ